MCSDQDSEKLSCLRIPPIVTRTSLFRDPTEGDCAAGKILGRIAAAGRSSSVLRVIAGSPFASSLAPLPRSDNRGSSGRRRLGMRADGDRLDAGNHGSRGKLRPAPPRQAGGASPASVESGRDRAAALPGAASFFCLTFTRECLKIHVSVFFWRHGCRLVCR